MNLRHFSFALFFFSIPLPVWGGTLLHDNGPFVTGVANSSCLELTQFQDTSSPFGPNSTLGIQSNWINNRVIDDFIIPPGEAWDIETLRWRVYQLGAIYDVTIPIAYVRLWTTDPLLGGEPLVGNFETNRQENSFFSNVIRTPPSNSQICLRAIQNVDVVMTHIPPLPPGRYWVEVGFDSDLPNALLSPPTEPRQESDNAIEIDFSGVAVPVLDVASNVPLDFPFQLYGDVVTIPSRACILPSGDCIDATRDECSNVHSGEWNFLHLCEALGACCNHADGTCIEKVGAEICSGAGLVFSIGQDCSGISNCGMAFGACCFGSDAPNSCQGFMNGINCTSQGGSWRPGSCSLANCNDKCATPISVEDGDNFFDNFNHTTDQDTTPNSCDHNPFVGESDAWFAYESSLSVPNGHIEFSLCASTSFDTTLQIYQLGQNTNCEELEFTATASFCDNDGCGVDGGGSYLIVPANPGDEFLIRIGGYAGAQGGGNLRITPIENGTGACCSVEGICEMKTDQDCLSEFAAFFPGTRCDAPSFVCPEVGACCRGALGCELEFEHLCDASGGVFLGADTVCVSADDCDGDGETNQCALELGAPDCNANGIPDSCDVAPGGAATDCDLDGIPDECQDAIYCCPGDVNGDAILDGRDIEGFVEAMLQSGPPCFTTGFCRLDVNGDFSFDSGDLISLVDRLLNPSPCPVLVHVSGQVNVLDGNGVLIDVANRVFLFDESGNLLSSYLQIDGAAQDSFGYRDGASDGQYVYFGWGGGVARHNADGSNGILLLSGPTPGTNVTWRALAFDPTGDNGNGSLWTQSFTSDLVESTLTGQLLNQFPNDFNLYGLAYDRSTGMLWGHDLDANASARVVQIDPETGLGTGVEFPSHFNVPGGSAVGLGQYGGLSYDEKTNTLYGLLQASPSDAKFHADMNGNLLNTFVPNPREDVDEQTGTIRNLGIVISRP